MKTLTQETVTPGQLKLITRMIGDVADSKSVQDALGALCKEGAERLKGNPEFVESLCQFTITQIADLSVSDKFKNEEVYSTYGYLSGYKPKGITEQTNILRQLFPGIGFADEKIAEGELPKNTEGWFAIPKWQTVAPTYGEAVQKVLDMIKKTRNGKFYNNRKGQLGQLRQSAKTASVFQKLGEEQKDHDILVVPAQFGLRHRGRSVRRAREVIVSTSGEFGLGAFAVGIMILTHPERLMNYNDLWIDCAGDEFDDPGSGVRFGLAPYFRFRDGRVEFDAHAVDDAREAYGSASGVVPQN